MTQIYHLNSASAVLAWDQRVMMPQNQSAAEARGCQSAAIAGTIHDLWTSMLFFIIKKKIKFSCN